jgi:hypothetical protein
MSATSHSDKRSSDQFKSTTIEEVLAEQPIDADDPIDEAAEESFPASDPPTFTGTTASPSKESASSDSR